MQGKRLTPVKSIRAKCLDCSAGSPKEVKECPVTGCVLYPYRLGKHPALKGKGGNIANLQKNNGTPGNFSSKTPGQGVSVTSPKKEAKRTDQIPEDLIPVQSPDGIAFTRTNPGRFDPGLIPGWDCLYQDESRKI
jgi:hypothetical protein